MAGHRFQDPLREGAGLVWASTHKSFPGPPGGLVMTQLGEIIDRVAPAVYPGLVTNHNPGRMPALGLAAAEMIEFGDGLRRRDHRERPPPRGRDRRAGCPGRWPRARLHRSRTRSCCQVAPFGSAREVGERLEAAGIVTTATRLPSALGDAGIRLGLAELTRRGAAPDDMPAIAELIADVIARRRAPEAVRATDPRDGRAVSADRLHLRWAPPVLTTP